MNSPVSSGCAQSDPRGQSAPDPRAPTFELTPEGRLRIHLHSTTPRTVPGAPPVTTAETACATPPPRRRESRFWTFGDVIIHYAEYPRYWTAFYHRDGKRIRESRASYAALKKRAETIALNISNGRTLMNQFSESEHGIFLCCKQLADSIGVPQQILMAEAVEARKKLSQSNIVVKDCPEIAAEFFTQYKFCDKWQRNLKTMVERFAKFFTGPLPAVGAEDITKWLDQLPGGLRTRRNHRNAVSRFLTFARKFKYLAKDADPLANVEDPDPDEVDVQIYTPDELVKLLNFAEGYEAGRKLVPLICITAFAGVRHGEMNEEKIHLLDWKNVHFKSRRIVIPEKVAKNTSRRSGNARAVDMPPNLIAWLQSYAQTSGKICPLKRTADALCKLREKAGITGDKKNALRKSFISYQKALTGDIAGVADSAGNSAAMIRKNYLHVDEDMKEDAQRWFKIMPQRADVLPLFTWQQQPPA